MTEKTLTTENIKPALDALRGELAPWPVVAKKQDRLNTAQLNAANSGITSSLVAQIIANTAAIRALESAITGTGLRALVVSSLPAVGTTGILYIVPVTTYDPDTDADVVNYSNEYIWIPVEGGTASEGHYEQVGQTGIVINNGQLTITVNGTPVGTFTANQSGDTTAAITVPTNADYVDRTTDQTVAGVKTFSSTINGTASKAIADEDGTSIKTGYGKLAGNNTWTGNNTFSGIKSTGVIRVEKSTGDTEFEIVNGEVDATTNTLSRQDDIRFYDKNTKITGGLRLTYTTDTGTKIELYARSWKADGTASYNRSLTIYTNGQTGEYYTTLETNFLPKTTSVYSLGSSSYQWSSVYAQTYYYNGTAWGLDKSNVWTGDNTYTDSILSKIDSSTLASYKDIYQCQNGTGSRVVTFRVTHSNASRILSLNVHDNNNSAPKGISISNDGSNNINLSATGTTNSLGSSTVKWTTLNGINPGALSLPSDSPSSVNLDPTNWNTDGNYNRYTAPSDGWVGIQVQSADITDITGQYIFIGRVSGGSEYYPQSVSTGLNVDFSSGKLIGAIMVPVKSGISYDFRIKIGKTQQEGSIITVRFYPMLGNV